MRNRGKILRALYVLLLGNPALRPRSNQEQARTRFKTWWLLIGSSVEHASALLSKPIDFQTLFLQQEDHDEESTNLADALEALARKPWGQDFSAADVMKACNEVGGDFDINTEDSIIIREFLYPELKHKRNDSVSAKSVGHQLKKRLGEPVRAAGRTLTLKTHPKKPGYPDAALRYLILQT